MSSVKTNSWYFWMVTYYTFVASMGCLDSCNKSTLQASLGSVVLLKCSFGSTYLGKSPDRTWVVWSHGPNLSLVNITYSGQVDFLASREGRVKVFPNEGRLGNFSIRIDALQALDLGSYCCESQSNDQCHQVDLEEGFENTFLQVLFFSVGGVVSLIVLLSVCICMVKWKGVSGENEDYVNTSITSGASHERPIYENNEHDPKLMQHGPTTIQHDPTRINQNPTRTQQVLNRIQQDPTGNQQDPTRIQNDPTRIQHDPIRIQQDPTRIQQDPTRIPQDLTEIQHESPRNHHKAVRFSNTPVRELSERKKKLHTELVNILRKSSVGRHYYANQAEINQQARAQMDIHQMANDAETQQRGHFQGKQTEDQWEYENPIYNKHKGLRNGL